MKRTDWHYQSIKDDAQRVERFFIPSSAPSSHTRFLYEQITNHLTQIEKINLAQCYNSLSIRDDVILTLVNHIAQIIGELNKVMPPESFIPAMSHLLHLAKVTRQRQMGSEKNKIAA